MLRFEELQQLSGDRARRLHGEAEAERLARPDRRRRQRRRERRALVDVFGLLVRPRRAT